MRLFFRTVRIIFAKGCDYIFSKRLIVFFSAFCIVSALFASAASAAESHSWYIKRSGNELPVPDAEFSFIKNYDCFYANENVKDDDRVIYLTFDAGYDNGNVERIVDILNERGAKGAFFVLSHFIEANPEVVKKLKEGGHLICNHTASHHDMSKVTDIESFSNELKKLEDVCRENGVECAKYYRPPEGKFSEENLRFADELGYKTVLWSFAYCDWDNNSQPQPEASIEKIMSNTHNGEIILLHPTSATNAAIMGTLIDRWTEAGYRFGSLDELQKA